MFLIDYLPDTSMASISNSPVLITAWSRLEEGRRSQFNGTGSYMVPTRETVLEAKSTTLIWWLLVSAT